MWVDKLARTVIGVTLAVQFFMLGLLVGYGWSYFTCG